MKNLLAETETSHDGLSAVLCAVLCCAVLRCCQFRLYGTPLQLPSPMPEPQPQHTPKPCRCQLCICLAGRVSTP